MGIREKIQIKVVPKTKNSFYHHQYSCKLLILLIINVILLLLPINTVSAINNNKQRRQKQTKQRRYLLQEKAADPNMFNYGSNQQKVQGSGTVAGSGNPFTYNSGLKNSRLAVDQSTAALMENLKHLNSVIQKAARLRIGKPSTKVIAACRKAVKKNNIGALLQIISTGEAPGR